MMDGISITLLVWLIGSHFLLYYKIGKLEEVVKNNERKIYKLIERKFKCDHHGK